MARHPLDPLSSCVGRQHGHFSIHQARAAEISKYAIHRLQAQALIERGHRNVYRLTSVPVTWKGRLMASRSTARASLTAATS